MEKMKKPAYDLEERLLEYSVRIIKVVAQLPNTRVGNHVAGQLQRSGTSPYPNHGEAQAAESPKDFIHKLRISLKELRESQRWLKLIQRVPFIKKSELLTEIKTRSTATSLFDVRCWTFDVRRSFNTNIPPFQRSIILPTNFVARCYRNNIFSITCIIFETLNFPLYRFPKCQ
jgi:four helix bundle protein